MPDMISLALVGIGGYGNSYVKALLDGPLPPDLDFRLTAAIDPAPHLCRRLDELTARGVRVFRSLDEFYATDRADLAVISTPLHLHAEHTTRALSHGSHVLCEKPLCVTPDDATAMARARDAAKRQVAIGYQWSFSAAIQRLKADILAGAFGRPKRMRCLVLWPRDEVYYSRNRWAGAKSGAYGHLVLDSPVNNACAHYLHNLFYLFGPAVDRSDNPAKVTAELYRANPIENYDTAAVRCRTVGGAEILFVVSHATRAKRGPLFSCEFERATVSYVDEAGSGGVIVACFADGTTRSYGSPNENRWEKLWSSIRAAGDNTPTVCGIEAAAAHTRCAWAAQQSMPEIVAFPRSLIRVDGPAGARRTWVDGLGEVLERCYESYALPSAMSVAWAAAGAETAVTAAADDSAPDIVTAAGGGGGG
jgi:predicted dehydrogenase